MAKVMSFFLHLVHIKHKGVRFQIPEVLKYFSLLLGVLVNLGKQYLEVTLCSQ